MWCDCLPDCLCLDNNNSIAWIGLERLASRQSWTVVASNPEHGQQANFINLKKNVLSSLEEDTTEDFCVTLKESGDWNTYRDCRSVTNKIQACNVCQFEGTPLFTLRGACPTGRVLHLDVEVRSEEFLRQLSYAIKNQRGASKDLLGLCVPKPLVRGL